jgi:outer membrane immunogenic protein
MEVGTMRSKTVSLLAVAFSLGFAQAASAADMPVKARPMAPVPVAFSWTGCYVGGNVGDLWGRKDWYDSITGIYDVRNEPTGFLGGGHVGCNYQTGAWVFGIQGDYDWTNASATNTAFATSTFPVGQQLRSSVRGLASVTGRVGYSWDRFLVYGKGGAAWVRDNYYTFTPAGVPSSTASETRSGWTVGVGGEYAFAPNWSAFVEYDYYGFGTRTVPFNFVATGAFSFNEDIRQSINVVKVGVNWRFTGGM